MCPTIASPGRECPPEGDPIEPRALGRIAFARISDSWPPKTGLGTASRARSFGATISLVLARAPRRLGPLLDRLAGPHPAARKFDPGSGNRGTFRHRHQHPKTATISQYTTLKVSGEWAHSGHPALP